LGLNYGASFRNVRELFVGPGAALGRISLAKDSPDVEAAMHPAILDACLHLFPAVSGLYGDFSKPADSEGVAFLPIAIESFVILAPIPGEVWSHCKLREGESPEAGRYAVDVRIHGHDGALVAVMRGLTVKRLARAEFLPRQRERVEDWLYYVDWIQRPALPFIEVEGASRWLVVTEQEDDVEAIVVEFRKAGVVPEVFIAEDLLAGRTPGLDGDRVGGVLLATALSAPPLMTQKLSDLTDATERQFRITKIALELVGETLRDDRNHPKLWIVTRGAQAPLNDRLGGEALQAVLWGHGRVIALEHPSAFGALIDIDERTDTAAFIRELLAPDDEEQVALRDGLRFVPRLHHRTLDTSGKEGAQPIRSDRSYLVTGGLGTLGLKVASWLVAEKGARDVWLVGRSAPSKERETAIVRLEAIGATIHTVSADISNKEQARQLFSSIKEKGLALGGVFHCAGLLDDRIVADMDWEHYHRVTAPKIEGAWALHLATQHLNLDHFVLFSSILSVIGSMGQFNYVAGNAFMDALVAFRRRMGLAATAMNWGPWEEAGLATESGERGRAIWRARGTNYIPADSGLEAMTLTLAHGFDHAVVTLTDWSIFISQFTKPPHLYQQLTVGHGHSRRPEIVDRAKVKAQLQEATPEQRRQILIDTLVQVCATNLQLDTPLSPYVSLREAGLDSLLAITVINDIESIFEFRPPARALLRGPSVVELAELVLEGLPRFEDASPLSSTKISVKPLTGVTQQSRSQPGSWLVVRTTRPEAKARLFCFPFAGGGSAVFDNWSAHFDPAIEIVAVEPPGRLSRIDEAPVRSVEDFARGVLSGITDKLDRPYGVIGHCLGGLTLYETVRFLQARERPLPVHIFISGARPPNALRMLGDFEKELDTRLRRFAGYRARVPAYEQPDNVFSEIVRAFGIAESDMMIEEPELRQLVLPTVRAEFAMADRYVYLPEDPLPVSITCFRGLRDTYFREIHARAWSKFTSKTFETLDRDTGHLAIVEDFDFIRQNIENKLLYGVGGEM
jgi:surfactin synthase thioesterase subunit/NAD(P)-dependent dehydrogenase (short-subunit alcohol dehydrogenase family)/acyl carrier protein